MFFHMPRQSHVRAQSRARGTILRYPLQSILYQTSSPFLFPHISPPSSTWTTSKPSKYAPPYLDPSGASSSPPQDSIEKVILDPKYHAPLTLVKAIRNGAVYGTKVRFPHAMVMIFLFRSGTIREKLYLIYKATRQHAMNLAKFALLYKSGCLVLKKMNGDKEESFHAFMAGLWGGYWVFGHGKAANSSVNQQIVIYVFARVVLACAKIAVQPPGANALEGGRYGGHGGKGLLGLDERQIELVKRSAWPVFASVSWASVMWIFRFYPETLQASLRSSMTYMYVVHLFLSFLFAESMNETMLFAESSVFTDTGLPRLTRPSCLDVDTTTRRTGMAWTISYGITSDGRTGCSLDVHIRRRAYFTKNQRCIIPTLRPC